jgi:hypothetical protein
LVEGEVVGTVGVRLETAEEVADFFESMAYAP